MAFFLPQTFYHIQAPQNPLYHLLRELDQSVQQPQRKRQCQPQQKSRAQAFCPAYRVNSRPWEPRFEAHETEDSFVLYGELPGMNKEHVTVEFPEPRKLVVSGKVERFTEEPKAVETATTTTEEAAPAPVTESDNEDTRSRSSYQATVEDDVDDDEFEVLSHTSEKSKTVSQPEPETLCEKAQEKQPEQPEEPKRSGYSKEFSRYFTFPTYINHDAVTADLKDGLLTIVVPKATPKSQRIIIN